MKKFIETNCLGPAWEPDEKPLAEPTEEDNGENPPNEDLEK